MLTTCVAGSKLGRQCRWLFLPLWISLLVWSVAQPPTVAAHATLLQATPASGVAVAQAPTEIQLFFNEPVELRYSTMQVFDATRQDYVAGALTRVTGQPQTVAAPVRALPPGNYLVSWRVVSSVDGHSTTGRFAFAVGTTPPPALSETGDLPGVAGFEQPSLVQTIIKWLTFCVASALVGLIGLRLLVWLPTMRSLPELAETVDRQLLRRVVLLAGLLLLALWLLSATGMVLQAAQTTKRPVGDVVNGAVLNDFLFNTRTGAIWAARLLLPPVGLMLLASLLLPALRGTAEQPVDPEEDAPSITAPLVLTLLVGLAYLLTISLISHAAAAPDLPGLAIGLDWMHLVGTSVWLGGLPVLLLASRTLAGSGIGQRGVVRVLFAHFSRLALGAVAVLTVTGAYSAWRQVGSLAALTGTAYGQTLLAKLALVMAMGLLGVFNHRWLRAHLLIGPGPAEQEERVVSLLVRQWQRGLRTSLLLGVLIMLAVAFLTGLPPAYEALQEQARHMPELVQWVNAVISRAP